MIIIFNILQCKKSDDALMTGEVSIKLRYIMRLALGAKGKQCTYPYSERNVYSSNSLF